MSKEYLNVKQTCEFLKIGRSKLFNLKKEGGIPFIQIDKTLLFDKDDLIAWMESHKQSKK